MLEASVGRQTSPFPGAKDAAIGAGRLGTKPTVRKFQTSPVARGKKPTSNCYFSDLTRAEIIAIFVQHENFHVRHGVSDRYDPRDLSFLVGDILANRLGLRTGQRVDENSMF